MKFTIGIPVRNGERFLKQAITSAISQTREPDEILIIDDASSDSTAEIIHSFNYCNKIRYVHNNIPTGFADAFNRIFYLSKGDFVILLSSDDLLEKEHLFYIEKALTMSPSVLHCYCGYHYIDESGNIIGSSPLPYSLEPVYLTGKEYAQKYLYGVYTNKHINRCLGFATKRELVTNKCSFRKEAGLIADDDFFMRIGNFTNVVGISQPLACVRIHRSSITSSLSSLSLRLAEDYLFQIRHLRNHTLLIEQKDIKLIYELTAKFINLLLYEGLKFDNLSWTNRAIAMETEFNEMVSQAMKEHLPLWGQILWLIIHNGPKSFLFSKIYVRLLAKLIKARKFIKKAR